MSSRPSASRAPRHSPVPNSSAAEASRLDSSVGYVIGTAAPVANRPACLLLLPAGLLLLLAGLAAPLPALAGQEGQVEITEADRRFRFAATRTPTPPVIDGDPGDAVWERAEVLDGFVQATPDEGEPVSERTEVRVLYDDEALYISAYNHDREPGRIVATVLRRDQRHQDNDAFMVTLDTYHDHRNGFYFETNPVGAKFDAQIIGEGGSGRFGGRGGFNADWDAVWEVRSRVVADGWTVEMAIPFWSLRFEADRTGAWGVNFRRTIRRKSEEAYWAPIPRQYNGTRLSMSGLMTGMSELGRPRNLQLKPYAIGSVSQEPDEGAALAGRLEHDSDVLGDVGGDLKWGVTPNLTLDVTGNPDFSQVEADDEQINLTRFPLFFPEKREFFLENAGLFQFGSGGGPGAARVVGFHSRRIGISEDNQEVPLFGGARLTGKVGAWSLGFLSMQSQDALAQPSNNYSVARVRRDLGSRSNVGVLFTNRQASGADYNRELGIDGRWAIDDQTTVDAWWMQTDTRGEGDDWAGRTGVDWGTPSWQVRGSVMQIGDNFNPEMGFVSRTGVRVGDGSVHWTPYFPEVGWLRNLSPHVNMIYTTDTDARLLSRFLHLDWDVFLRRGDKLSVAHNRTFEQLDFPFEISPGIVVPPGAYHNDEINLELQSDASRPVSGSFNLTDGTFWSGERQEIRVEGGFRAGARLSMDVSWTRNDVELPQGDFVTDLVRTRLDLDFSTRLSLAGLIQYNSRTDQVLTNLRFNFIHTPGADLFVVYNERRLPDDNELLDRAVIVKLTHLLRF